MNALLNLNVRYDEQQGWTVDGWAQSSNNFLERLERRDRPRCPRIMFLSKSLHPRPNAAIKEAGGPQRGKSPASFPNRFCERARILRQQSKRAQHSDFLICPIFVPKLRRQIGYGVPCPASPFLAQLISVGGVDIDFRWHRIRRQIYTGIRPPASYATFTGSGLARCTFDAQDRRISALVVFRKILSWGNIEMPLLMSFILTRCSRLEATLQAVPGSSRDTTAPR